MKKLNIIYEDKYLLVVDKPAGLLTISTQKEKERTLYYQASAYVYKKHKSNKVFIVNRLDKDTSGIVVFAKERKIKEDMQNNWDDICQTREYFAVVEGKVAKEQDLIKSYLKENKMFKVYSTKDKDGKLAITEYKVISRSKRYSLLNIQLRTGRKNQIRVHLSDIGHPVVGDKKYGAQTNPLRRMGLHANKLVVEHPITKELMMFSSKTPQIILNMFGKEKHIEN